MTSVFPEINENTMLDVLYVVRRVLTSEGLDMSSLPYSDDAKKQLTSLAGLNKSTAEIKGLREYITILENKLEDARSVADEAGISLDLDVMDMAEARLDREAMQATIDGLQGLSDDPARLGEEITMIYGRVKHLILTQGAKGKDQANILDKATRMTERLNVMMEANYGQQQYLQFRSMILDTLDDIMTTDQKTAFTKALDNV